MNRVGKARTADRFPPAFDKPCAAFTLPMKEKGLFPKLHHWEKFWFFCFLSQVKLINMTAIDADLSVQQELWESSTGSSPSSALTSVSLFLLPSCHTPQLKHEHGARHTARVRNSQSMGETLDSFEEDWHINPGLRIGGQSLMTYFYWLVVGKLPRFPAMCQVLLEVWRG